MPRQWQWTGLRLLVLSAVFMVASTSAGDEWDDFHITIDPSSPTDDDTFDLRAWLWFSDSGYLRLDQSISVSGNQIDVRALIQDQHTRPDSAFLTVMTREGAFFNDFGPLAVGTYHVNAEVWLTPWPSTSGGYLYDEGSLHFTVTNVGTSQTLPGDFNSDNVVDAGDYVAWRKALDEHGSGLAADGNGNNQVDSGDYNVWRAHFGQTSGTGAATGSSSATVPEPSTLVMLLIGMMTIVTCRRQGVS